MGAEARGSAGGNTSGAVELSRSSQVWKETPFVLQTLPASTQVSLLPMMDSPADCL